MRDLCDRVSGAQSHNVHKLVGFEPFGPAALAFRVAVTAAALARPDGRRLSAGQAAAAAAAVAVAWAGLLALKVVLGFLLKLIATAYVTHYDATRSAAAARSSSRALGARRVTMGAAALAGGGGGGKKDE